MLKKILIAGLATLVVGAVSVSAYNTSLKPILARAEPQVVSAAAAGSAISEALVASPDSSIVSAAAVQATQPQQQWRGGANGPGSPTASGQPQAAASGALAANPGQTAAGGQGRGNRFGGGGAGRQSQTGSADGSAVPAPQNGMTGLIGLEGTVSQVAYPNFNLTTADGETILASVGNLSYAANLGIDLSDGEFVSVLGYWDPNGTFAISSLVADGVTYTLRDEYGRPLWSGGANR